MLKGFSDIILGPYYFKRLDLGIQEKHETSLIIRVTAWKQKKSYKNKKLLCLQSL